MRIGFISPFLFRYRRGIERLTIELANALAVQGAEIHLITWRENRLWPWGELKKGVFLHALSLPRYFAAQSAGVLYAVLLQKLKLDVVNLFFTWHGEELALRLNPFLKSTIVLGLHYPAEQVPHAYQKFHKSWILKRAKELVAVSHYVADGARNQLGRTPVVIYNGVNLEQFYPADRKTEARKKLNLPLDSFILGTAATLEMRKGIQKVFAALPETRKRYPNLIYVVAGGDGPITDKQKLMGQVKHLELEGCVRFLGVLDDLITFYHAIDLFMFLPTGEAFPLALLEAMACGLPVIAAKKRPLEECVSPEGAVFVNDADVNEVAQAISELISNPAKRAQMGQENRRRAEKNFAWSTTADQYMNLFTEKLGFARPNMERKS